MRTDPRLPVTLSRQLLSLAEKANPNHPAVLATRKRWGIKPVPKPVLKPVVWARYEDRKAVEDRLLAHTKSLDATRTCLVGHYKCSGTLKADSVAVHVYGSGMSHPDCALVILTESLDPTR